MLNPPRLTVGVIGVGRVGSALGQALSNAGHQVIGFHAVSASSTEKAQALFPNATNQDPIELSKSCDLLMLCVPDDALEGLINGIYANEGFRDSQFVVHTSGVHGLMPLFLPVFDCGAVGMALHPAMTFTGAANEVQRLANCPFAVTTVTSYRAAAEMLVIEMGGEPVWIDDPDRVKYHAALTHASNHMSTVVMQAEQMLREIGVSNPAHMLSALSEAALENVLTSGASALTGPVSRGDVQTVRWHLAVLDGDVRETYRVMALATVEVAERTHRISAAAAAGLREVLAE